ncbi:MAG: hypothetical protein EAZ95_12635 [Bacteroidetes bacterium]|nr:MAG: hypothetical protein EAZ95_12635 [Bacteroidota bacterium]
MFQIQGNFTVNGIPFADWFNQKMFGNTSFPPPPPIFHATFLYPYQVQKASFEVVMSHLADFTGKNSITMQEFIGHFSIMYNETGGLFLPLREAYQTSSPARYCFEGGSKYSYNQQLLGNRLAGNQLKSWGIITSATDVATWNGQIFPINAPIEVIKASFKCDYFRFRGWGFNQLTWRNNYLNHLQPFLPKPIDEYEYEEFEKLLSTDNLSLAFKVFHSFAQSSPSVITNLANGDYAGYGMLVSGWRDYVNYLYMPRCQNLYNTLSQANIANVAVA